MHTGRLFTHDPALTAPLALLRESGSNKFGAFAAASTGISALLQWLATRSGLAVSGLPSGPYGLIFAAFVQYFFQVGLRAG